MTDDAENLFSAQGLPPSGEDSQESFSLLHPPKIGRYSILRRLGKGSFGQVLLAYDEDLDRPVAIKVPNPERVSPGASVEAFLTEARILAGLDHPPHRPNLRRGADGEWSSFRGLEVHRRTRP